MKPSVLTILMVILCMLGKTPLIAQQTRTGSCSKFSSFTVLDNAAIESHVLSRAEISSPLLATINAHADIPVLVFVNKTGSVICASAKGKANPMLKSLTEQALVKWKFAPYLRDGLKIPFQGEIIFHIDL